MRTALCAAAVLLLTSASVGAADDSIAASPGNEDIRNICIFVSDLTEDTLPGSTFKYRYQRAFMEAAGVDIASDDAAAVSRKVSAYWAGHQAGLRCNSLQFDVADGGLLKLAVHTLSDAFLYDAVAWRLDLNYVDASDQRTVLDYIRDRMKRAASSTTSKRLQKNYDLLREAGAKHRAELK